MMRIVLCRIWQFLRQISGDDAYERHRQHWQQQHGEQPALSPRDFYRQQLQKKWNGINRCC